MVGWSPSLTKFPQNILIFCLYYNSKLFSMLLAPSHNVVLCTQNLNCNQPQNMQDCKIDKDCNVYSSLPCIIMIIHSKVHPITISKNRVLMSKTSNNVFFPPKIFQVILSYDDIDLQVYENLQECCIMPITLHSFLHAILANDLNFFFRNVIFYNQHAYFKLLSM